MLPSRIIASWSSASVLTTSLLSTASRRCVAGTTTLACPGDEDARPGRHQTPQVDALWRQRDERTRRDKPLSSAGDGGDCSSSSSGSRAVPGPKPPSDSALELPYLFSSDAELRDSYANPWGFVRMGRMMEDLDALAGNVAASHCADSGPGVALVTASIDEIELKHRANLRDDMVLSGVVKWTGTSSLVVGMSACSSWTDEPWLEANVTYVARDQVTGKAAPIAPLEPSTPAQQAAYDACARAVLQRKKKRALLSSTTTPNNNNNNDASGTPAAPRGRGVAAAASSLGFVDQEELELALALVQESRPLVDMPALASPNAVLMEHTRQSNMMMCQPQHRNTRGHVFGGFLVRRALELAFATAYNFCGAQPVFREAGNVSFLHPIDVGDLLRIESRVHATTTNRSLHPIIHVGVDIYRTRPEETQSKLSNQLLFAFEKTQGGTVRKVLPATLEEAQLIVERMRAL